MKDFPLPKEKAALKPYYPNNLMARIERLERKIFGSVQEA
jgi:hypothetical protein